MSARLSCAGSVVRALRLPFVTASVLPFIAGTCLAPAIRVSHLLLGLAAVLATHLCANVLNDYADSKSGVDWHDPQYYGGLFSGSKLIQEGRFSERFYLMLSIAFAVIAFACVVVLSLLHGSIAPIVLYVVVLTVACAYSVPPFRLSYRYMGEAVVFLLFGPAPVMAGYYVQTGSMANASSWLISLPFGFLTAAILVANEIPDFKEDQAAAKRNLTHLLGPARAFVLYYALAGAVLVTLLIAVTTAALRSWTLVALLVTPLVLAAGDVLRQNYLHKARLTLASKLTIAVHSLVSLIIILDLMTR